MYRSLIVVICLVILVSSSFSQPPAARVELNIPPFTNQYIRDMIDFEDGVLIAFQGYDDESLGSLVYFTTNGLAWDYPLVMPDGSSDAGSPIVPYGLAHGPDNTMVVVGQMTPLDDDDRRVFAGVLDATGAWVWTHTANYGPNMQQYAECPVVFADGSIAASVFLPAERYLMRLSPQGDLQQFFQIYEFTSKSQLAVLNGDDVAVTFREYVDPANVRVDAYDETGDLLWSTSLELDEIEWSPFILSQDDGSVLVAASAGESIYYPDPLTNYLVTIDPDGTVTDTQALPGMTGVICDFFRTAEGALWLGGYREMEPEPLIEGHESYVARLTPDHQVDWVLWQYHPEVHKRWKLQNVGVGNGVLLTNALGVSGPYFIRYRHAYALNGPAEHDYLHVWMAEDSPDLIELPDEGGDIWFEPTLTRYGDPGFYDFWVKVQHETQPDNAIAFARMDRWVPAGDYTLPITLTIPGFAPGGYYTVEVSLGQYPSTFAEKRTFRFHKDGMVGTSRSDGSFNVRVETGSLQRK